MNPADILSLCVAKAPDGKHSFCASSGWLSRPRDRKCEYSAATSTVDFEVRKSDLPVEQWLQVKRIVETTKPDTERDGIKRWLLVYGFEGSWKPIEF